MYKLGEQFTNQMPDGLHMYKAVMVRGKLGCKDLGILRDGLLPCPFCGEYSTLMHDKNFKSFYMYCDNCLTQAYYKDTKQQAIDAWNRRV